MSAVDIKLYVAEREPRIELLQQMISAAAGEAGVEATTEVVTVRTEDEARLLKSLGSPTIRVNGFDIEYAEREPPETTTGTRYYSTPAGWQAFPEQGMIVFAIREALAPRAALIAARRKTPAMPDDDQPQAEPAADADAPVPPTQPLRESPPSDPGRRRLRGTGSGFGHTDDPGGMAAEFARRVREAAEQRRPAIARTARDAIERAREAADAARPQIERLAQQAKHAAEAARPHVEQAARDASAFASEHEAELRAAAGRAAQVAGRMAVPPVLRPFVDAAERELHRDASPPPSAPPTSTPPQSTPPRSTQSGPVEEPPAGGERNA